MKRARFTDEQIIGVLKEHEAGAKTSDLARKHGVAQATLYNWQSRYGGMEVSEAKSLDHSHYANGAAVAPLGCGCSTAPEAATPSVGWVPITISSSALWGASREELNPLPSAAFTPRQKQMGRSP